jgi:hypothetical protein
VAPGLRAVAERAFCTRVNTVACAARPAITWELAIEPSRSFCRCRCCLRMRATARHPPFPCSIVMHTPSVLCCHHDCAVGVVHARIGLHAHTRGAEPVRFPIQPVAARTRVHRDPPCSAVLPTCSLPRRALHSHACRATKAKAELLVAPVPRNI